MEDEIYPFLWINRCDSWLQASTWLKHCNFQPFRPFVWMWMMWISGAMMNSVENPRSHSSEFILFFLISLYPPIGNNQKFPCYTLAHRSIVILSVKGVKWKVNGFNLQMFFTLIRFYWFRDVRGCRWVGIDKKKRREG